MKGKSQTTDHYKRAESNCIDACSAQQKVKPCPPADIHEADGQGAYTQLSNAASGLNDEGRTALSVTRRAQISVVELIDCLACGVDTLDIGFYVDWGAGWEDQRGVLDGRKSEAQGTDGNLIDMPGVRPHIFLAGGKAPNYRYHIKFAEYHCFIAISRIASISPNVYVSFTSEALHWELSDHELIDVVRQDVESLGGSVMSHKISRCDLYADFKIPGGLSLDFLRDHKVGRAKKTSQFMDGETLETFYVGSKNSPIQIRIYDKGKEIRKHGTEERWLLIWFIEDSEQVWRIEAQLRRDTLSDYKIETIDDLIKQKADLWKYATVDWFSLRYPDDDNSSRRTIHEFWLKVQGCADSFGSQEGTKRHYKKGKAAFIEWHLKRIENLLVSCSALLKDHDPHSCMQRVNNRILGRVNVDEFVQSVRKKSIELGIPLSAAKEAMKDVNEIFGKLNQS